MKCLEQREGQRILAIHLLRPKGQEFGVQNLQWLTDEEESPRRSSESGLKLLGVREIDQQRLEVTQMLEGRVELTPLRQWESSRYAEKCGNSEVPATR